MVWLILVQTLVMSSWVYAHDELLAGFPAPQADFEQHVSEMRRYLLDTQLPNRTAAAVELNLPFQINANDEVPYRGKYLLIHGLERFPSALA